MIAEAVLLDPNDPRLHRDIPVADEAAGWRADTYLAARFTCWSRSAVRRHIQAGDIVSTQRANLKASTTLVAGEILRVYVPGIAPDRPPPPLPPIVFEDARLLVFNKPPDMLAHPAGDKFSWAIIGLAKAARPNHPVMLVHRLDRDTSGLLVMTKDHAANVFLKAAFKQRDADLAKQYLAIARGHVAWETRTVDAPIGDAIDSEIRLRRGVTPDGDPSRTSFEVVRRLGAHTLVRCLLHTGRTHQIRIHLDHCGHPLLGDRIYGQPDSVFLEIQDAGFTDAVRARVGFPRQALHAWRMRLPHPDGGTIDLEAPLPADLQSIIDGDTPNWPAEAAPTG